MRRLSTAILAIGIALVFVLYMVTYTVDYNQIAIITTFDKATEPSEAALANKKDSGSVIVEPGLKFKWPWPIQRVQVYPTQLQVLQDTPEQLLLSDGNTIIINMTLTWRIDDPLAFFKSLGTIEEAQDKLLAQMRSLRSIISNNYGLTDLVNTDPNKVKLDELEEEVAKELTAQLNAITPSYGIEVADVTVGKMLYTSSTAESVNQRTTSKQEGMANNIRKDGQSQADAIVSKAENRSKTLLEFTNQVAAGIERIGKQEAAAYLEKYTEEGGNEALAIYLDQLETMEQMLGQGTTFVIDARTWNPLNVLIYGPGDDGDLGRLFNEKNALLAPPADLLLPAPVSPKVQADSIRKEIEQLKKQLDAIEAEATPTPVRTIKTDSDAEARQ
ncbi:MAG: SPFH domain-containing protein [Phycisphaeraceae bacterium]